GDDQPAAAPSPRPGRAVRESAPATVQAPDGGRVGQLLPQLYLHGLALGDFDLALRGLLGDGAPLSAASIARLKAGWQAEYELWRTRSLADLEPVILVGGRGGRQRRAREGQGVSADGRRPVNAEIGSPPTTSENVPPPMGPSG